MSEERDEREGAGGLTPGDPLDEPPASPLGPLGEEPPPPPEPPPLPEQPLGPPSMADDPPPAQGMPPAEPPPAPAQPLPPPPPPAYAPQPQGAPTGYPPPQAPPAGYPPPQGPPTYTPPQQAPPAGGWQPPAAPGQPPAYPPHQQPPGYPPPFQPRPPRPRGPHGQPIWDNGVELSGWGARVGALLLDGLIAYVPPIAVGGGLLAAGTTGTDIAGGIILGVGLLFAWALYASVFMARGGERNGQTLGKQIVGIRVVRDDNSPYDLGTALVRELLVRQLLFGVIGGFFFGLAQLLDYLWPLWDETNRALHDMIANRHVVRADPTPGGAPSPTGLPG